MESNEIKSVEFASTSCDVLNVPLQFFREEDVNETQELFNSWGLTPATLEFLKMYGVNFVDVLQKMEADDVEKLFELNFYRA